MEKNVTSHILKGIIIGALLVILDILLPALYNPVPDGVRYMPRLVIVFIGILLSVIIYGRQFAAAPGFGDAFSHGLKTTAVIAFIMALYSFIVHKIVYPMPTPAEMDAAVKAIQQQGNALHEEAVLQAANGAKNRWVIYASISIFASLIPGLLGSLAGAALTKKNLQFKI